MLSGGYRIYNTWLCNMVILSLFCMVYYCIYCSILYVG